MQRIDVAKRAVPTKAAQGEKPRPYLHVCTWGCICTCIWDAHAYGEAASRLPRARSHGHTITRTTGASVSAKCSSLTASGLGVTRLAYLGEGVGEGEGEGRG